MNKGLRKEIAFLTGLISLGLLLKSFKIWAGLGVFVTGFLLLSGEEISLLRRSVIITGGSRGLGLAIAKRCLKEGAYVSLLARDRDELSRAQEMLEPKGQVQTILCDITDPEELKAAFNKVQKQFGHIDILINNAGSISVGPFETMQREDFDAQLELHLQAVVTSSQLITPIFKRSGGGNIINISSIGGAIPVPHMSTYCASKFALAGLSETLSVELAQYGIQVTTVYPGLMRTGSPIQAIFKGNHEKEYGWFATGDVMPGLSISADIAAKTILDGIKQGKTHISYPGTTKLGIIGHALFPELYAALARQAARIMPKGKVRVRKTGAASQHWLEKQIWYKPLNWIERAAEQALNQIEKFDADFNLGIQDGHSHAKIT